MLAKRARKLNSTSRDGVGLNYYRTLNYRGVFRWGLHRLHGTRATPVVPSYLPDPFLLLGKTFPPGFLFRFIRANVRRGASATITPSCDLCRDRTLKPLERVTYVTVASIPEGMEKDRCIRFHVRCNNIVFRVIVFNREK